MKQSRRSLAHMLGSAGNIWLIISLAFVVRVGAIIVLRSYVNPALYEHGVIATNILAGKGFSIAIVDSPEQPTSQQTPLYPYMLAFIWHLMGKTQGSMIVFQLIQAALSAIMCGFVYLLGSVMYSRIVGLWAGITALFYPPFVYTSTHVQVVTLVLFFLAGTMYFCWQALWDKQPVIWWAVTGFFLGCGILTDPIMTTLVPVFISLLIICRGRQWKGILRETSAFLLVIAIVLTPWTIRNYYVHHRFVMVKTTFWYSFWQGNNPASMGTDKIIPSGSSEDHKKIPFWRIRETNQLILKQRDRVIPVNSTIPSQILKKIEPLTEVEKMDVFRQESLKFLHNSFWEYIKLCGLRLRYFLWVDVTNPKTYHPVYRGSYLILIILTLVGVVIALRERKWWQIGFCLGVTVPIALFHILTIYAVRFRMPIELVYCQFASLPLSFLTNLISGYINVEINKE